jgi:hypothetical protein
LDQHADRVTRVSQGNQDSNPKSENSSRVTKNSANTESWVTENLATMESRGTENSTNTESWVTENSADSESRVMKNLVNEERRVTQLLGNIKHRVRQEPESKERCYSEPKAGSTVVPEGYYQDAKV